MTLHPKENEDSGLHGKQFLFLLVYVLEKIKPNQSCHMKILHPTYTHTHIQHNILPYAQGWIQAANSELCTLYTLNGGIVANLHWELGKRKQFFF